MKPRPKGMAGRKILWQEHRTSGFSGPRVEDTAIHIRGEISSLEGWRAASCSVKAGWKVFQFQVWAYRSTGWAAGFGSPSEGDSGERPLITDGRSDRLSELWRKS